MTKISVYDYKSFKKFLLDWIAQTPSNGRGQRKLMAQAMGCQTPFITQVLGGDYHFSMEQAEACTRWLGLSLAEAEFFILLVQKERAGTRSLENFLDRQIQERREQATQLTKRLQISETLTDEDQQQYYSSWQYSAVHMALLVPELRTLEDLHEYFAIPLPRLMTILDFLTTKKLVKVRVGKYELLRPVLHLGRDSPLLGKHHANWRLRAIEAIDAGETGNFHYSGVIALSRDDFEWTKARLAFALEEIIARVRASSDEKVGCLALDLFGL